MYQIQNQNLQINEKGDLSLLNEKFLPTLVEHGKTDLGLPKNPKTIKALIAALKRIDKNYELIQSQSPSESQEGLRS